MKKNRKIAIVISSAAVIGVLFLVSFQPETNLTNPSLEENIGSFISPMGRVMESLTFLQSMSVF